MSNTQIQLQVSESSNFNTLLVDKTVEYSSGTVELTEDDFSSGGGGVPYGNALYSRIRHNNSVLGNSIWSNIINFMIKQYWDDIYTSTPVKISNHIVRGTQEGAHYYRIEIKVISPTKAIVSYIDDTQAPQFRYLRALLLIISNNTISASTSVQCSNDSTDAFAAIAVLSSTKCIVCSNSNNPATLHMAILTISGTTLTASTLYVYDKMMSNFTIVARSSTEVLFFGGRANRLCIIVASVIGTTISIISDTLYPEHPGGTTVSGILCVSALDISESQYLIGYLSEEQIYLAIVSVIDSNISVGSRIPCGTILIGNYLSLAKLSNEKVCVSYVDKNDNNLYAQIVTIIEGSITTYNPVKCSTYATNNISSVALTDERVLVLHVHTATSGRPYVQLLHVNGNIITIGSLIQCNTHTAVPSRTSIDKLTNNTVVLIYRNIDDENKLYAQILSG